LLLCQHTFEAAAKPVITTSTLTKNATAITVTGNVADDKGLPLPGVTITVKGGSGNTVTDNNGNFKITADENATLIFSFVGFVTKEVALAGKTTLNVSLESDNKVLDEVVVIGYGTQKKKEITSAVTNLQPEDFNKGNINNPAQLLQGKVAGLSIVSPQGNPNGNYEIRLRGLSTLGANTQPLIIIDGVIGADLNSIDPNDIATLDVLKDGGAAAIYGTRGSSGVILITSKTGVKGKSKIDYNGYVTTESKARTLPVMGKEQYLSLGGTDLEGNTTWLDKITRTAISHVHNLGLSGGTEQTTYLASLNYRDAQGVLLNTGFKQLNGRLNLTQKAFNNRLIFTLNLAGTTRDAKLGFDDAFRYAIIMPPSAPIKTGLPYYSKYGGYFQSEGSDLYNPVAIVNQNINDEKIARLTYNINVDFKPFDNFTASVHYARNTDDKLNGQYISKYSYYGNGVNRNGLATKSNANINNNLFEATGNYVKSVGALDISVLGGYSFQNIINENFFTQGGNFLTDAFTYNNFAAARDFTDGKGSVTSGKESNKIIAFFGRVNLNYDNTYFLSASLRREGSSRFGENHKWGNFPGVSAGVDVARLIDIPKVNQLKVRGSYGVTGAMPGQSYLSQQLYGPGGSPNYFLYNGVFTPVYSPQSNPNP
ncbi:MAG: SusC/RagA family TonB-linked outer membrane protein, partial [Sphingobacteriaceae bacterium]